MASATCGKGDGSFWQMLQMHMACRRVSSTHGVPKFTQAAEWEISGKNIFESYRAARQCDEDSSAKHLCSAVALLIAATPMKDGESLLTAGLDDVVDFVDGLAKDQQNTENWPAKRFIDVFQ